MSKRTTGILLIAVVALGAMTGVAAAESGLDVTVDDTDGQPTVNVTHNDTAVENATVVVSVVDEANESYDGAGSYVTDANGTVELPVPDEDVTVEVTAASDNETASTTADLEAPAGLEVDVSDTDGEPVVTVTDNETVAENASVNVTTAEGQNETYVGEGDYETDENGTVTLLAAEENVTIEVTASFENETVSTTADLTAADEVEGDQPFGQLVREFIERLDDREGGIGDAVSDFVTENNPGNAPDHAGGPSGQDDAGNASDAPGNAPDDAGQGNDGEQGPPADAGQGNDGEQGPPDHAGNDDGTEDDAESTDSDEDAEDEEDTDDEDDDDSEDDDEDDDADGNNGNNGNGNGNGQA